MNASSMRREIAQLASGTVARLCGSPLCEDVDAYVTQWLAWLDAAPAGLAWPAWQDCHADFVAHLEATVLPLFAR